MLHNVAIHSNKNVFNYIQIFLNVYYERSINTGKRYQKNIEEFFRVIHNKELNQLNPEDLDIDLATLTHYITLLKKSGNYKDSTIQNRIESIRSLYKFLKGNRFDLDLEMFTLVAKHLKDDRVNVGFLSYDETLRIAEAAKREKHKGLEKYTLILLALTTSMRKEAILNIRYEDIRPHDKEKDVYIIGSDKLFDKGSMVKDKEIPAFLYNLLLSLSEEQNPKGKIFTISYDTLNPMIKRLAKQVGITQRNISFHSIKRAGVDYANEIAGLYAAQRQAGHKSPETTTRYIQDTTNIVARAMIDNNIDSSIFDELTRDEMLTLLKSVSNGEGMRLRKKAKEIIDSRS